MKGVKTSEEIQRKAVELRKSGMSFPKISETLNLHISTIRLLYERYNDEVDQRTIHERLTDTKRLALYSRWELR